MAAPAPAPPASAPYVPPPAAPAYEAPAPRAPEQTWTPIATPAWTPGDSPSAGAVAETRTPTVPPPTPARTSSVPRPAYREPRERPAWLVPAIAVVAILLLLGIAGGIYLATRPGTAVGGVTHNTPSPKVTPKASPTATSTGGPQAVPVYAPASAPPVTSVVFLPDTSCKLGGPCKVDVEMKYSKAQSGQLGYVLKFFDRCTGATRDLPGRSFTPPSGFIRADPGFQTVTLPSGVRSAALVAVSTTPAAAASTPLFLGADSCS
jgi:hypothetical protein